MTVDEMNEDIVKQWNVLVNYCLSKKMLAKEIEAEEKLQIAQAENR